MNTQILTKAVRLSRVLTGGAALAIAAAVAVVAPLSAYAQKAAKGDGTPICDFSGFNYNPGTNTLQVNCTTTTTTDPNGASTYAIAGGITLSTPVGTAISTQITRSGGSTAEALTINHAADGISGWNFNGNFTGSQTLNFAAGEMSKTLVFTPGPTLGWLRFTLASVVSTAGSTVSGASQTINVVAATTPTTTVPGCTTSANHMGAFQYDNQKLVFAMKPGETGAIEFTPSASGVLMYLSTTETVNTPPDADHEVTVSACPGDFNPPYPCRYQANYVGSSMQARINGSPWQCPLEAGKKMYLNVRHVRLRNSQTDPVSPSCLNPPSYGNGACEVRMQITGL